MQSPIEWNIETCHALLNYKKFQEEKNQYAEICYFFSSFFFSRSLYTRARYKNFINFSKIDLINEEWIIKTAFRSDGALRFYTRAPLSAIKFKNISGPVQIIRISIFLKYDGRIIRPKVTVKRTWINGNVTKKLKWKSSEKPSDIRA